MGDFEVELPLNFPLFQPPKSPKWGTFGPVLKPYSSSKPPIWGGWGVGGLKKRGEKYKPISSKPPIGGVGGLKYREL